MPTALPLVLIADGHADCADTLALALELGGWQACTVRSGTDALVWLRRFTPQAAVLDARLPVVPGLDVARVMRANVRFDRTRVVLTHTWLPAAPEPAGGAGIDSVWLKPFGIGALLRELVRPRQATGVPRP